MQHCDGARIPVSRSCRTCAGMPATTTWPPRPDMATPAVPPAAPSTRPDWCEARASMPWHLQSPCRTTASETGTTARRMLLRMAEPREWDACLAPRASFCQPTPFPTLSGHSRVPASSSGRLKLWSQTPVLTMATRPGALPARAVGTSSA